MSIDYSSQLEAATSSKNIWDTIGTKVIGDQADIPLLRAFFDKWIEYLNKGETNQQAYQDALKTLPKDNPETLNYNEGVTEDQLKDKVLHIFGKPLFSNSTDPNTHINTNDVNALKGNQAFLRNQVRRFVALGMMARDERDRAQKKIYDIENKERMKDDPNIEDNSDYDPNTDSTGI